MNNTNHFIKESPLNMDLNTQEFSEKSVELISVLRSDIVGSHELTYESVGRRL
jgi:hypothetical protein